jgi:hypothetical protein
MKAHPAKNQGKLDENPWIFLFPPIGSPISLPNKPRSPDLIHAIGIERALLCRFYTDNLGFIGHIVSL